MLDVAVIGFFLIFKLSLYFFCGPSFVVVTVECTMRMNFFRFFLALDPAIRSVFRLSLDMDSNTG